MSSEHHLEMHRADDSLNDIRLLAFLRFIAREGNFVRAIARSREAMATTLFARDSQRLWRAEVARAGRTPSSFSPARSVLLVPVALIQTIHQNALAPGAMLLYRSVELGVLAHHNVCAGASPCQYLGRESSIL